MVGRVGLPVREPMFGADVLIVCGPSANNFPPREAMDRASIEFGDE